MLMASFPEFVAVRLVLTTDSVADALEPVTVDLKWRFAALPPLPPVAVMLPPFTVNPGVVMAPKSTFLATAVAAEVAVITALIVTLSAGIAPVKSV